VRILARWTISRWAELWAGAATPCCHRSAGEGENKSFIDSCRKGWRVARCAERNRVGAKGNDQTDKTSTFIATHHSVVEIFQSGPTMMPTTTWVAGKNKTKNLLHAFKIVACDVKYILLF